MRASTLIASQGALVSICTLLSAAGGADFHVAADVPSGGDGSKEAPWSLSTALAHPAAVQPGDTIWIGDGVYRGGFTSSLKGAKEAPITVRAAGGRAIIDCKPRDAKDSGAFAVGGEWTTFWGLEFTCSDPTRVTQEKGSWPAGIRRGGIDSRGSHISFINMIVHDTAGGFSFWGSEQAGEGGEIYGCVIYHNGWRGPDRGHGHGIYAQNAKGTKRIVDNVIFNQFGYGLHAYGSDKAFLRGFHVEGNVAFNNGCLAGLDQRTIDLMVGGGSAIEGLTVVDNCTHGGGLRIGYASDVRNRGIAVRGNYIRGGARFDAIEQMIFSHNTVIAPGTLLTFHKAEPTEAAEIAWDDNRYHRTKSEWAAFNYRDSGKAESLAFPGWQKRTGFDARSQYEETAPRAAKIFVRPNRFEKGRAHIIVYNWQREPDVELSLGAVLARGERYRIISAQNVAGEAVATGTWTGEPIRLPMKPTKPVQPVGMPDYQLPVTEPEFGVFLVLPLREE